MDYAELAAVLRDDASPCEITAFPDGSIDVQYHITDASGDHLGSRAAFGERIASGDTETFSIEQDAVTLGGQAVNMAYQAHELGDCVALYGHLDDPRFDSLAFETVSMGAPATVYVYDFDGEELMLADSPDAMSEWSLGTLRTAMGGSSDSDSDSDSGSEFENRMTADAVCCANWISFDGMTTALSALGDQSFDGNHFVLDPGDLTTEPRESILALCEAVGDLEQTYDAVLSMDGDETAYLAELLSIDADSSEASLRRLEEELTITGVVLHGSSEAIAATPDGTVRVPTICVEEVNQLTGAGDRFGAGVAHGLARGWGWESAVRLGNLCASYYVEHGDTGSRAALSTYADRA